MKEKGFIYKSYIFLLLQDKFTFTYHKVVNIYIAYKMNLWPNIQGANSAFRAV